MATINDLPFNDTPSLGDQVPVYSQSSGTTQRTSVNQLLAGGLSSLPTVQPVDGSDEVWIDPLDGNAVKVAIGPSAQSAVNPVQTVMNLANGTAPDAGALTGAEIVPMNRSAGLLQTTLTTIAQWVIQTYQALPAVNTPFVISESQLSAAPDNILTNGSFNVWPSGMATSVSAAQDVYVCGNWRLKSESTVTVPSVTKYLNTIGGMALQMVFGASADYLYVRQLAPNVMRLSGRTFTMSADVEVDSALQADVYIQARINSNDAQRVLVVDSGFVNLPIGRSRVALTFQVPNLVGNESIVDFKNSLEFSFRFYGQNQTVNAKIYEIGISSGPRVRAGFPAYPERDQIAVEQFYEVGQCQITGLNTTSGQKRLTAPFRTRKYVLPASTGIVFDVVGNVNKISTYDVSGNRTDNVAYTALSVTQESITVILNASTAAGIGFSYTVNVYP